MNLAVFFANSVILTCLATDLCRNRAGNASHKTKNWRATYEIFVSKTKNLVTKTKITG